MIIAESIWHTTWGCVSKEDEEYLDFLSGTDTDVEITTERILTERRGAERRGAERKGQQRKKEKKNG